MEPNALYSKIRTDENLMETIAHGSSGYPFRRYLENIAQFDFHCVDWHWHTELEFMYLESGTITAWIGDSQLELTAGNGIFINSRILHRFYSPEEARMPNFVFMPSFIASEDSLVYRNYVLPVISSSLRFLIFSESVPWQARVLSIMQEILTDQGGALRELRVSALIQTLWLEICSNIDLPALEYSTDHSSASIARLQMMMHFIHLNYPQALSLEDIAHCAAVSKSTALNLFQRYLQVTPVDYLIRCRLKQAALLLSRTEKKVNAIADETGFHSVDYFCRTFKAHYGLTPTQYRRGKLESLQEPK